MTPDKYASNQAASGLKSGIFAILFNRDTHLDTALCQLQGSRRYSNLMQFFSHIAYILKISIRQSIIIGGSTGWYVMLTLLGFHSHRPTKRKGRRLISPEFRERLMITVTNVNQCVLCSWAHSKAALMAGIPDEEVRQLLVGDTANCPPEEREALLFAQHWADTDGAPDADAVTRLTDIYGEKKAQAILVTLGVMRIGNYAGNAVQFNLTRLKRKFTTQQRHAISDQRIKAIKLTLWVFAPSAIIIGIVVQWFPVAFWNLLGLGVGADATLSRLYGAVLLGVGLMGAQALSNPIRHATLLLFISYYKGIAALVLLTVFFTHPGMPVASLIIGVLYGGLAALCFALYPRNSGVADSSEKSAPTAKH